MEEPTRPLLLTGLEVVFLCDSIKNEDLELGLPDPDAKVPIARNTLLLLASAYIEVVTLTGILSGPVLLEVTEEQVWLFRSKTVSGSMGFDGKNIGISLLLKFYDLLVRFKYGDKEDTEDGEQGLQLSQADLKTKLEEFNAGANKDAYTNQDNGPNSGAGASDGPSQTLPGSKDQDHSDSGSVSPRLSHEGFSEY
jgi:hypothetical protein